MVLLKNDRYTYVFIVGCPRSGKTLLQKMLASHDKFAWFSQYSNRFQSLPIFGILNRFYNLPILGNFLSDFNGKPFLPHPVEMSKNYNEKLKGIGSLGKSDVTNIDKKKMQDIFEKQLKYQNKRFFLTDEGRPARMLYLKEIFPKSKFIHVIRDGRSVVATLLKERPQWFSEDLDLYSFYKPVPKKFNQLLLKYKGTKNYILALATLRWKMAIFELEKQSKKINKNEYLLIKYEDLINNKINTVDKILKFLGLNWTNKFKKTVLNKKMYKNDNFWKNYFSPEQKKILNKLLGDFLLKYKYDLP